MNGSAVVDASQAVKWMVQEDLTEAAVVLAGSWAHQGVQLVAPYLIPVEVANSLFRKVAHRELSSDTATLLLDRLIDIGVGLREPRGLHIRAMDLAAQLRQPAVYDSHYLALAQILDCDLWTADERFFRAAAGQFPSLHWIGES